MKVSRHRLAAWLALLLSCSVIPPGWAGEPQDAEHVAKEYEQELKAQQQKAGDTPPPSSQTATTPSPSTLIAEPSSTPSSMSIPLNQEPNPWNFSTELRMGVANYKEEEQNLASDYTAFYPEADFTLSRQLPWWELELSAHTAVGQSVEGTESWDVNGRLFQTNDMDLFRLDSGVRLGKILHAGPSERLRVVPYVGYGYRFFHFSRKNFNILSRITIRDTVNESYQIHYVDTGFASTYAITDHWKMGATASIGGVFYNQANNSVLGKVRGEGGTVGEGSVDLRYALGRSWEFSLGAFVDLQALQGGDANGGVIWPDNHLYLYGGMTEVRYKF